MMNTVVTWEIKAKNTPLLIKKCSHCDSNRFYCSDKFRMNAQKKNIDVWLIYRCVQCDNTCNLTLLSRKRTDLIDKALFHSFSVNDTETAWKYAFSPELERQNNATLDFNSVDYEIVSSVSMENLLMLTGESVSIRIKCSVEFSIKLPLLLRRFFPFSSSQTKQMLEQGIISIPTDGSPQKYKVRNGDVISIDIGRLSERSKEQFCKNDK
jgi:hypothetical protein